jgi:phage gp29-like protein
MSTTHDRGYVLNVNELLGKFNFTEIPELQPGMDLDIYERMVRTDSQVIAIMQAVKLPVLRTKWRIKPAGARPEVVALVSSDLGLPVEGQDEDVISRSRGRFSWAEHLEQALSTLEYGHAFFEQVYKLENGQYHLRKLAPRPQNTITDIEVARDGGLVGIRQQGCRMSVRQLVAYRYRNSPGDWRGQSMLRPAYKNWLIKDKLIRVQAMVMERNGMGVPVYTAGPEEEDLTKGQAMANEYRSGDSSGAALPFDAKLELKGVSGNLPDIGAVIQYHDEAIGRAALTHFLNLGNAAGSWALGTAFSDFFTMTLQTVAEKIADTANAHIIEDLVDLNFGADEPAPRLVFEEIGSRQVADAGSLTALINSGVITPDATLETDTRYRLGLPPRSTSTEAPTPTADEVQTKVLTAGTLIRSGFTPAAALELVGLDPIEHTGLLPVTVQHKPDTATDGYEPGILPAPTTRDEDEDVDQ